MEKKKDLSTEESLEIITQMINKAKCDYTETGVSALLWGTVITICSLVSFYGFYSGNKSLDNIWWLTVVAVTAQVILSIRESRKRKFTSHNHDAMGGIWISFGITMFLFSYYVNVVHTDNAVPLFLIAYGIPTFASGIAVRFKPMIYGGIACWLLAIAAIYTKFPYNILFTGAAAQLAWFIPGLILRSKYLKAKSQHV